MTDISTITSVTDVTVLHDIIVTFDKQVRQLEEDLSKVTDKINQVVEENAQFRDEIVRFKALDFAFKQTQAENVRLKSRIIELEHRLGKTAGTVASPLRVMVLRRPGLIKVNVPQAVNSVTRAIP